MSRIKIFMFFLYLIPPEIGNSWVHRKLIRWKKTTSWQVVEYKYLKNPNCWRRLLRVPWTARRSNQSILKEISPGCSLEGMMLKLKLQYLTTSCKELTHCKRLWCLEGLGSGGEGDDRGWDGWMASLTQWTRVWVNSGRWWSTGRPGVLWFMGSRRVGQDWATELNWIRFIQIYSYLRRNLMASLWCDFPRLQRHFTNSIRDSS